jgi:hypothetical protein
MISDRTIAIWSAFTALAITLLIPGSGSLWIDEAQTFHHVAQPTFSALWRDLLADQKSEGLMPLGMFVAWVSGQLIGSSEWQMRAPNILWAALTVLAFVRLGRLWHAPSAPILVAVQPFLWYYGNEARPYALQIACGAWLAVGCAEVLESRRLDARTLLPILVASAALVASTMFGIITAVAVAMILAALGWHERWVITRGAQAEMVLGVLWWASLGAYYVWKVASGAKGARLWDVGLQNLGFAFYEFSGFAGLGPGRDELRQLGRTGGVAGAVYGLAADPVWIVLLLALLSAVAVALRLAWQREERRRELLVYAGVCALVVGTTFTLSLLAGFPFWGRHLAPIFPFYCALLALGVESLRRTSWPQLLRVGVVASLLMVLAFSSAQLRWSSRHAKDDYRSAATIALTALRAGRNVWWSADSEAAAYYGLPLLKEVGRPGKAAYLPVTLLGRSTPLPVPDMIVMSKSDVFDPAGELGRMIRAQHFRATHRLKAFTVWER